MKGEGEKHFFGFFLVVRSCERRGGIKQICVRRGNTYIGQIRMTCNNGASSSCGLALGSGSGGPWLCRNFGENFVYSVDAKTLNGYVRTYVL